MCYMQNRVFARLMQKPLKWQLHSGCSERWTEVTAGAEERTGDAAGGLPGVPGPPGMHAPSCFTRCAASAPGGLAEGKHCVFK